MNIEKISIRNFRNFGDEFTLDLNPQFTVIIGINGKGKSTILHALRIASGAYLLGIPEVAKRHILEGEIRRKDFENHLVLQTPTTIKAVGSIDDRRLSKPWQRQIPMGKTKTTSNFEDVGEIRDIAKKKYTLIKEGDSNIDNPVIAYFGTGRLFGSSRNRLGPYIGRQIFKYGYANWFDMQYGTYQYPSWLNSHRFLVSDKKESPETFDAFLEAVRTANPLIKALDFDGQELRLKVKINGDEPESQFMPLSLHSDGIITHTAMVAELAFRCIMLNAHHRRNAVKETRGIVMIDEIDLHLHPTWQRHVVNDLKNAFPKIQFVATTHSPFIVQSLKASELVNLDRTDGLDRDPNKYSIEEVSSREMGIENAQRSETFLEMQKAAKEYFDLIKAGANQGTIAEAKFKLDQLRVKYNDDPAYVAFLESEFPKT
jgi:predicted ATP-binding protein involved in virulence